LKSKVLLGFKGGFAIYSASSSSFPAKVTFIDDYLDGVFRTLFFIMA
jgi:hypothetical protein